MKNNRPYKYDSKNRLKKKTKNKNINFTKEYQKKNSSSKVSKKKVNTKIRIDMNRINDSQSLDTSFLEGRIVNSEKKEKKVKEKILKTKSEELVKVGLFLRRFCSSLAVVFIIFLIIVFGVNAYSTYRDNVLQKSKVDKRVKVEKEKSKVIDTNYLFVGGYYTKDFNFKDFDLDYHYVKSFEDEKTTTDLISSMKKNIYDYNPSTVFLELGLSDLKKGITEKDYFINIEKIIDLISKNRPYAEIYVESFYPINESREDFNKDDLPEDYSNDGIIELNNKLKKIVSEKKVNYLDVYSMLEVDGVLNSEFTDDGIHLNDDGYRQVLKVINKVVG